MGLEEEEEEKEEEEEGGGCRALLQAQAPLLEPPPLAQPGL